MTQYRVYKSGEDEPVRVVGHSSPQQLARPAEAPPRRPARFARLAVIIALVAAAAVLTLLYGREVWGDITGVVGLAGHLRRLPHWTHYAIPVAAILVFALVTYYLAFGRHIVLKAIALALLVAALATPGYALGYVNRNLSSMGGGGTAEQKTTVAAAGTVLQHPLPDKPVNILLLGIDHAGPGDPGRSDSQIVVRLDPQAKTISMLSLPRDLYTDIPGVGYNKLNAAYSYGGVKLAVKAFSKITGLPINHFVRIDFSGFWQVINVLGGVYLPIDHRYYNPEGMGFQPINLQPGYQLLKAKQALSFVRFRHDQKSDFTRMVRQQMFLREVQRQAMRWSGDWQRVLRMTRAIMKQSTTDLDSLSQILPVVNLALTLNTSHIYQTHVEGSTPTIGGVSYVVDTPSQIAAAVQEFENPPAPHARSGGASPVASPSASPSATSSATTPATPAVSPSPSAAAAPRQRYDWSAWRALAQRTSLTLEAPTTWDPSLGYDTAGVPFRAYSVETPDKRHVKAAIAVGTVAGTGWEATEYWGIQALNWTDPPAIANPNSTRTIGGRTYLLFYQDKSLHMVAWQENGATYWVINTLDNVLTNHLMMALAESCQPVNP
jgi:polyisoprenyl-teichoic acid--peptidoglycan teichoic acid transferase